MDEYKYISIADYRFNRLPEGRCSSCKYLSEISDSQYAYQCSGPTFSTAALLGQGKIIKEKCGHYTKTNKKPETAEDRRRASGMSGGFLQSFIIISAIAFIGAQVLALTVMGQGFNIKEFLLRIPLAFAGYLVGWVLRWIVVNIMKASTSDLRDKFFGMVLPLLAALLAALFGPTVVLSLIGG